MDRVLLVDDELIDLEGLELLVDWASLGMTIVAALHSGREALRYIEEHALDVLVTDIRMPSVTGLELARQALERSPMLKVVFISGYEDFQCARQAIALQAAGYVLKPVDDTELYHVLLSVREALDRERRKNQLATAFEESAPLLKSQLILQLLQEPKIDAVSLVEQLVGMGVAFGNGPYSVAILEADDLAWKLNPYSEQERSSFEASLTSAVANVALEYSMQWCRIQAFRYALITGRQEQMDTLDMFIPCVANKSERLPFSVTIGAGGLVSSEILLHESYKQAAEALEMKLFLGKGQVLYYTEAPVDTWVDTKDLNSILAELFAAMSAYQLVRIDDCLEELFQSVRGIKSKITVSHFSLHIISKLEAHLQTLNENFFKILDLERKNLDIIYYFETISDIQSWLRRHLFHLSEHLHNKKNRKNRKLVEEVMKYVDQHLDQNMTLRDVADYFSFSPNHLGLVFYEEAGIYFSDYMIQARLEKASQLLKDPTIKIFEVANQVGYRNIPYFSKLFRAHFGVTPGEYRKQC